jgi:hypothetical protein
MWDDIPPKHLLNMETRCSAPMNNTLGRSEAPQPEIPELKKLLDEMFELIGNMRDKQHRLFEKAHNLKQLDPDTEKQLEGIKSHKENSSPQCVTSYVKHQLYELGKIDAEMSLLLRHLNTVI